MVIWTRRRIVLAVLVPIACVMGGLRWVSVKMRNLDLCVCHGASTWGLLQAYTKDHAGRLPSSLNELIETGYLRCQNDGTLSFTEDKIGCAARFDSAPLFDITWGITPEQIEQNGYVPSRNRFIVVPAAGSPCQPDWCAGTSENVAKAMKAAAALAEPATAPGLSAEYLRGRT